MEMIATWIGLAMTALGMILGGVVYVQAQLKADRDKAESKIIAAEAKVDAAKKELEERHKADLAKVEKAVDEERIERRRELDRMEETVKGFADVASAVIAMGKSMEHLAQNLTDHQRRTETSLDELKQEVRALIVARPVRAPRASRTKK